MFQWIALIMHFYSKKKKKKKKIPTHLRMDPPQKWKLSDFLLRLT